MFNSSPVVVGKEAFVKKTVSAHNLFIFSKSYCPYPRPAKGVFSELNKVPYVVELAQRDDGVEIQDALKFKKLFISTPMLSSRGYTTAKQLPCPPLTHIATGYSPLDQRTKAFLASTLQLISQGQSDKVEGIIDRYSKGIFRQYFVCYANNRTKDWNRSVKRSWMPKAALLLLLKGLEFGKPEQEPTSCHYLTFPLLL